MNEEITTLRGVGEQVAKKFHVLGLHTVRDLIYNFPRKYEDYSKITKISELRPGQVTLKVNIKQVKARYAKRGLHITEAVASDASGSVRLVWFNQPYRAGAIKKDKVYYVSGVFEFSGRRLGLTNPSMELVNDFPVNTARIIPVYRETKGLKSFSIRKILQDLKPEISKIQESLPKDVIKQADLMPKNEALLNIHFPETIEELDESRKRLGFEEIFTLILAGLVSKKENSREKAPIIEFDLGLAKKFVAELPFKLTGAQRRTVWQVYKDMGNDKPMNRLLEGDVGSGKTVVSAMSAIMAISKGFQVALMAPTELLARQHADSLYELLKALGMQKQIVLLVGGLKPAEKNRAQERIASGDAKLIIGTHAVISEKVDMQNLALVIVDEQHRFGVEQRQKLQKKAGIMPHVLSMTATPIPRTLALTVYGELDISILDEMPPGRKPIITEIISPNSKQRLFEKIDKELIKNKQMFVVCPLITESDMLQALSAEQVYKEFKEKTFKDRKIGLLHGKMKSADKENIMAKFVAGKLDILVSTTVIEVGVNVPNASIMLVEGAERFGLAQIHQLRGRVGRSYGQGYCYLLMSDSSAPSRRLRAIEQSTDGFKLAQMDLEIRGPGAIYGRAQHGQLDLRIANLTDTKLIASARKLAKDFLDSNEKLTDYPELAEKVRQNQLITNLN